MPAGGEAAGGQRCRARKLQVVSLLVSLVSLVLSLLLILIVDDKGRIAKMLQDESAIERFMAVADQQLASLLEVMIA